jgi:hypothetical protein
MTKWVKKMSCEKAKKKKEELELHLLFYTQKEKIVSLFK